MAGADTFKHRSVGTELTQTEFEMGELHLVNGTTVYTVCFSSDTNASEYSWVVDEDTMVSNSTALVPTQQSVKAYLDTFVGVPESVRRPISSQPTMPPPRKSPNATT